VAKGSLGRHSDAEHGLAEILFAKLSKEASAFRRAVKRCGDLRFSLYDLAKKTPKLF
jgi:hypothetical protein